MESTIPPAKLRSYLLRIPLDRWAFVMHKKPNSDEVVFAFLIACIDGLEFRLVSVEDTRDYNYYVDIFAYGNFLYRCDDEFVFDVYHNILKEIRRRSGLKLIDIVKLSRLFE